MCENTLNKWYKRHLTLFGRIVVLKSLIISKFVHLFISLPNPPTELIKQIQTMSFKFIWNKGPDRIKRAEIIRTVNLGGLGMADIKTFILSLKISWMRRLILCNTDSWNSLVPFDIAKTLKLGSYYALNVARSIDNPFWRDVLYAWHIFSNNVKVESIQEILFTPLWFNGDSRDKHMFFQNWYDKKIVYVIDLFKINGEQYSLNELKEIYRIRGTFLDYFRLMNNIPNAWRETIRENAINIELYKTNIHVNKRIYTLLKDKKGCSNFQTIISSTQEPISIVKWTQNFGRIHEENTKLIYSNVSNIGEIKLKDFQYKINNKILTTKSFLLKINKSDNDTCSYCRQSSETIAHLFLDCPVTRLFIADIKRWLEQECNKQLNVNDNAFIFSVNFDKYDEVESFLSLLIKYYIYKTKFIENCSSYLTLTQFKLYLKYKLDSKEYIEKNKGKIEIFKQSFSVMQEKLKDVALT